MLYREPLVNTIKGQITSVLFGYLYQYHILAYWSHRVLLKACIKPSSVSFTELGNALAGCILT